MSNPPPRVVRKNKHAIRTKIQRYEAAPENRSFFTGDKRKKETINSQLERESVNYKGVPLSMGCNARSLFEELEEHRDVMIVKAIHLAVGVLRN